MAESRICLNIVAGARPDSTTMPETSAIQFRLDRGGKGLVQLVRAVAGTGPIQVSENPKTLVDGQLLYEVHLSTDKPYADVDTDDGSLAKQFIGLSTFTIVLYGKAGTSVSVRGILVVA